MINIHICVPVLIQWPIPGMIWVLSSYISSAKSVIVVYSQCAGGYIQGEQPWRRYILGEHRYQSGYGSRYQYGHPTWMLILFFWTNYEFWNFCVFLGGWGVVAVVQQKNIHSTMKVILKPTIRTNIHICVPVLLVCPILSLIWVLSSYISSATALTT